MKKMIIPKRQVLRFAAKVKEIDRQYELNNNAELDNGVYHDPSDNSEDGIALSEAGLSYSHE